MRWIRSKVCFVEGTLVLTIDADGKRLLRPIETLREGDLVLAREEYGDRLNAREILATSRRLTPGLLHVHFADGDGGEGTIRCTDEHPFWVANRNADQPPAVSAAVSQIAAATATATVRTTEAATGSWIPAKHLQPGDQLTGPAGERLTITAIDDETLANWQPVYNLTVAHDATYFVSPPDRPESPLLVHNAGRCGGDISQNRKIGQQGERSSKTLKNTRRIPSTTRPGRYRVPDGLDEVSLTEIKNVAQLSNTSQIRDYLAHAQKEGLTFVLETRQTTRISGPLQQLIDKGLIIHRTIGQ